MSFIERAQKLRARGENARALLVLVEGLKRHPDSAEGIDVLLRWYALEIPTTALESDVVSCLLLQPDADDLLSTIVDNLQSSGRAEIAADVLIAGEKAGLQYVPPIPQAVQPLEQGEVEPSMADQTVEATIVTSQNVEEPLDTADYEDVERTRKTKVDTPLPILAPQPKPSNQATQDESAGKGTSKNSSAFKKTDEVSAKSKRRTIVAVLVFLGLLATVFLMRETAEKLSTRASLDAAIETLDPINLGGPLAEAAEAARRWPNEPDFTERYAFINALVAPSDPLPVLSNPSTPYGLAAQTLRALERGELEQAVTSATRLEHQFPDLAIAIWTQGQVLERRGKLGAAQRAYESVTRRNSEFLAGWLGLIRVQTELGNTETLQSACDKVEGFVSGHPYLLACDVSLPQLQDYFEAKIAPLPGADGETPDLFTTSLKRLQSARNHLREGRRDMALVDAEEAAKDPHFAAAQIFVAVLRVATYDLDKADAAMQHVVHLDGLSDEQLRVAQTVGPLAFAFAGRPDIGRRYVAMFGADVADIDGAQEGVFATRWNEWTPSLLMPLVARLMVMSELGKVDEAGRLAQQFATYPGAKPLGFVLSVIAEQGGVSVPAPSLDGVAKDAATVAKAAIEGRSHTVIDLATRVPADSELRPITLRFLAQAHLALRETGDAWQVLNSAHAGIVENILLDGMRLRVLSRFGKDNARFVQLLELLQRAEPVGVNRLVDLAYAQFWQSKTKESEGSIQRALQLNPGHRQGNWLYGLLIRSRGNFREAQRYFERSGRDYDNNVDVLIELGISLSDLGNYDEARKMFYKALLLDRSSLDALAGLGHSYVKLKSDTSARDLERIVAGYPATRDLGAQKAEALKWLAVVQGVREGNVEAVKHLDAAEALVGKRPDLLVERARFAEASSDFAGARGLYAQALQRNSAMGDAHLGLAKMAIREGDNKVARDHLERYLELEPRGDARSWAEQKLASF